MFKVGDKVCFKNPLYNITFIYEVIGILNPPLYFSDVLCDLILRRKDKLTYASSDYYKLFVHPAPPTVWVVYVPGEQVKVYDFDPNINEDDMIVRKVDFNDPPKN